MKICQKHWDRIRKNLEDAGLGPWISKDGEQAAARMVDQAEQQGITRANFDPLLMANTAVWANALSNAGLAIMETNEDGSDRCPICYLEADDWCEHVVGDLVTEAVKLGIMAAG